MITVFPQNIGIFGKRDCQWKNVTFAYEISL